MIKVTAEDIEQARAERYADYRRRHPEAEAMTDQQIDAAMLQEMVDYEMSQNPGGY